MFMSDFFHILKINRMNFVTDLRDDRRISHAEF